MLVHGSALQWHEVQPQHGQPYDFSTADRILDWGKQIGKSFRGHMLLDWAALPRWLEPEILAASPRQAESMLTNHVRRLCHYGRGQFLQWNVANEPISGNMRRYGWYDKLGEEYLDIAFHTAHQIDGATPLSLNQDGVEMDTWFQRKSLNSLLELIERLRTRKVPIKSIGIEGHLISGKSLNVKGLDQFFRALANMGLNFMVTELDVDDRALPDDINTRDAGVASLLREFLDVALNQPNCEGVVVWNLSDRDNWITRDPKRNRVSGGPQRPALLDAQYQPKPAWTAVIDALWCAPARKGFSLLPSHHV